MKITNARAQDDTLGGWHVWARVEEMAKSWECFSLRNTRRVLGHTTSDGKAVFDECSVGRRNLFCVWERPTLAGAVAVQAQSEHLTLGASDAPALDTFGARSRVSNPYWVASDACFNSLLSSKWLLKINGSRSKSDTWLRSNARRSERRTLGHVERLTPPSFAPNG